jgi:hypothetical protein
LAKVQLLHPATLPKNQTLCYTYLWRKEMSKVDILLQELSDLKSHCVKCLNEKVRSEQLAKVAQNLRDEGFQMKKSGKQFSIREHCLICNETTGHYTLLSLEKEVRKERVSFSPSIRNTILRLYNNKDIMDGQSSDLEIDHRITPYRYDGIEPEIPLEPTSEYLKNNYMVLTKKNNNVKRETCKKCIETDTRQVSLIGIKFFYKGNDRYEGTCEGCFWAYPEKWTEEVNKKLGQ